MANTKRMNRLEELGRVDSEKAYTKKGKKNLKAEKKRIVGELKKNRGGSMGGGMNPMGYSKDPTVESIVGYNPNRPMKGGGVAKRKIAKRKGGAIKRRGGVEWEKKC
jgi:hypothetical protein